MQIEISYFESFTAEPDRKRLSWEGLADLIAEVRGRPISVQSNDRGPAVAPAVWPVDHAIRRTPWIETLGAMVLAYDGVPELEQNDRMAPIMSRASDHLALWYPTCSDRAGHRHFHLWLAISRPIVIGQWPELLERIDPVFLEAVDRKALYPGRLFLLPRTGRRVRPQVFYGEPIDIDAPAGPDNPPRTC